MLALGRLLNYGYLTRLDIRDFVGVVYNPK
jgi:hypothetical protein